MIEIDCSRQTWAGQTDELTLAFLELLSEPKIDNHTNLNRVECMVTAQFHGLGILGLGTRLVIFQETLKPKVTYVTR